MCKRMLFASTTRWQRIDYSYVYIISCSGVFVKDSRCHGFRILNNIFITVNNYIDKIGQMWYNIIEYSQNNDSKTLWGR